MIKQTLSKYLFLGALVIGVVPFAVEFVFEYRMSSMLRFAGIRNVQPWYWLFTSACLFSISASLLFPFREEESWECECGYDLSYSGNTSTRCPECGAAAQLEWTSKPGEFSERYYVSYLPPPRFHWGFSSRLQVVRQATTSHRFIIDGLIVDCQELFFIKYHLFPRCANNLISRS